MPPLTVTSSKDSEVGDDWAFGFDVLEEGSPLDLGLLGHRGFIH